MMKSLTNKWHIQIDAVFHALPEYDLKNKKKNVEHTEMMEILERDLKSPKMVQYFETMIGKNWFLSEIHMMFRINTENSIE